MFLNLEIEEGEWFNFFSSHIDPETTEVVYDEPDSEAKVKLRSMMPFLEERQLKRKREVEHFLNPKTRSYERTTFFPDPTPEQVKAERDDTWDYVILDWENFKDAKTKTMIPCTRENKLKLMRLPVFDRFVAKCLLVIDGSKAVQKEAAEKN